MGAEPETAILRWGIVGAGDVADKLVAPAMKRLPEVQLVAACRRDPGLLREFARKWNVPRLYSSAERLFADPEIDAVYLSVPHSAHCACAVQAAHAGKHILVEKPMGMTTQDCRQMLCACQKAQVRLGVSYFRRTLPAVAEAKRRLDRGDLGRPVLFRAHYPSGRVDFPPNHARSWLHQRMAGGGALLGVGCHLIDLLLFLGGDITDLAGAVDRLITTGDADDIAGMICRFRIGAMGAMTCSYNSPGGMVPFEISGTEGRLRFDIAPQGPLLLDRQGTTERIAVPQIRRDELYVELIRSVTHHVQGNAPFAIPAEEGMRATVVMDALMEASYRRRWIAVNPAGAADSERDRVSGGTEVLACTK